jgi:adhesin transport system outer membrane protein
MWKFSVRDVTTQATDRWIAPRTQPAPMPHGSVNRARDAMRSRASQAVIFGLSLFPLSASASNDDSAAQTGILLTLSNTCSACQFLLAQSDAPPRPPSREPPRLDFRQLLQTAVLTHPSVNGARSEQQAALSNVEAARQQFFPSPGVQADSSSGRTATTFRVSQPLWSGGRLTADLRLSELREVRARELITEAQIALATRLTTVAQTYLANTRRRAAQERHIKTLNDLVRMIEQRNRAEVSATADVNLVRTRLAQAKAEMETYRALEASAIAQLASATRQPLEPGSIDTPTLPVRPPMLGRLLEHAQQENPRVRIGEVNIRLASMEVDRARATLWPTVSMRVERQVGEYLGSAPAGNRVFFSMQYATGAGLALGSQIAAAEQHAVAVQRTAEADRRDVAERVESEWNELESSLRRLPELRRTREGASDVLESNRRLFVSGRRSWIDLLNSVREIAQAEHAEADAYAASVGAHYRLGLLLGLPMWSAESALPS